MNLPHVSAPIVSPDPSLAIGPISGTRHGLVGPVPAVDHKSPPSRLFRALSVRPATTGPVLVRVTSPTLGEVFAGSYPLSPSDPPSLSLLFSELCKTTLRLVLPSRLQSPLRSKYFLKKCPEKRKTINFLSSIMSCKHATTITNSFLTLALLSLLSRIELLTLGRWTKVPARPLPYECCLPSVSTPVSTSARPPRPLLPTSLKRRETKIKKSFVLRFSGPS